MKIKKVLLIGLPILIIGVYVTIKVNSNAKKDSTSYKSYDSVHSANFGGLSTLVVKSRCAIIFEPDSARIRINKNENEEAFYAAADDAMFYISQARDFFKTKDIEIVQTDSRIINLYNNNQMIAHIDLYKQSNLWGTILFNGTDSPTIGNLIEIESDYNKVIKDK